LKHGAPERLINVIQENVITDNLSQISKAISQLPVEVSPLGAVRLFLEGRQNIETTWDYSKTYKAYDQALETIEKVSDGSDEKLVLSWFELVIRGHEMLEKAEANWSLANLERSLASYLRAADCFRKARTTLDELPQGDDAFRLRSYSEAYSEFAEGMRQNMLGYLSLRARKPTEARESFLAGKTYLLKAEERFADTGNSLGIQDARSEIVEGDSWVGQSLMIPKQTRVVWKQYGFFEKDSSFLRLLSKTPITHVRYPSEFVLPGNQVAFRIEVSEIAEMNLYEVGDVKLPSIQVRLNLHQNYLVEVEFDLELSQPTDSFTLYLLKTLNTEAVPTYSVDSRSRTASLNFHMDDCRLRNVAERILRELSGGEVFTFTNAAALVYLYDYSPFISPRSLGDESYSYLRGLFSEEQTIALQPHSPINKRLVNMAEDFEQDDVFFNLNENSSIMVVPRIAEWKVRMYGDILDYELATREVVSRLSALLMKQAEALKEKLSLLRKAVMSKTSLPQGQVRQLIIDNLDIRLQTLGLLELQDRVRVLQESGITEARQFAQMTAIRTRLPDRINHANSLVSNVETLYSTVYNLGQEYLSLVLAVNSDISTRAFSILNVVMVGTLGLSVLTSVLVTPISITLALLGVSGAAFGSYLYLSFVRFRVSRQSG